MATSILFIDVGFPRDEFNEPLGIEQLAGTIELAFHDQVHCELMYLEVSHFRIEDVMRHRPDIIAVSTKVGSYANVVHILNTVYEFKLFENPPVVLVGDILATLAFDRLLKVYENVICVLGEGEEAIIGIVEICLRHETIDPKSVKLLCAEKDVPNLAFILNSQLVQTRRSVVSTLSNHIQPKRTFLHTTIKRCGLVRAEASRGCPWGKCSFCVIPWKYAYSGWRPFSIQMVVKQLGDLSEAGARVVYFTDEEFIGPDSERMLSLLSNIIEYKRNGRIKRDLVFFASTSVRSVLGKQTEVRDVDNLTLLKKMRAAGFIGFFLGIESGSNAQLERYNKGVTADDNFLAIRVLHELGFETDIGFIMFDPEMSLEDLRENLDFIRSSNLLGHYSRFGKRVRVVPKTSLERQCSSMIESDLNLNDLEYSCIFKHQEISAIYDVFQKWELINIQAAYALQKRMRGRIYGRREFEKAKVGLCNIRKLDYNFLNRCLEEVEASVHNIEQRLHRIYEEFVERLNKKVEQ